MDQQTLQAFQSQLNNVSSVLIATHANPSFDAIASMTSFALSFEKMQKKVSLFCPTPTTVEFANLVGINKVGQQVGGNNLVVTLKGFAKSGVDKVSYNVEGDDFNLVVVPKPGSTSFDPQNISYSYSGVDAQLILLVDVQNLEQLGDFYTKNKEFLEKTPTANVDAANTNGNYAQFNLTNAAASSCVEIAGYLLQYLKYQIDSDIATNILYGLLMATNNLTGAKVRAETYELLGMMMRMGARRIQAMQFLGQQVLQGQPSVGQPILPEGGYVGAPAGQFGGMSAPAAQPSMPQTQVVQPSMPTSGMTSGVQAQAPSAQPAVPIAGPSAPGQNVSPANPPADWTQPKIYKGGNLG